MELLGEGDEGDDMSYYEAPAGRYAKTLLDHVSRLTDIPHPLTNKRMTTIICPVGGEARDVITIEKMIGAGMNVAMLNMAHGNHDYQAETLQHVEKAVDFFNKKHVISYPLAVAIDLVGPEVRLGAVKGGATMKLIGGATITLTADPAHAERGTAECMYVDYPDIAEVMNVGSPILLHNGVCLAVTSVEENAMHCIVETGGEVEGHSGMHFPGVELDLPSMTEKDRCDLEFAVTHGVDIVFVSMVRSAQDIHEVRQVLGEKGQHIMVISKIETRRAVANIDEIIRVSDGVMVMRRKLLLEMGHGRVFFVHRSVTARCNKAGKPVVVATQLVEAKKTKPATRLVEVANIANSIINGADCIMLTMEAELKQHPASFILALSEICKEAEAATWQPQFFKELSSQMRPPTDAMQTAAFTAVMTSFLCSASAIIVATTSGKSAQLVSRLRPRCPIISVTRSGTMARQNQLYRGIMSVHYLEEKLEKWLKDVEMRVQFGLMLAQNRFVTKVGDPVVLLHGWKRGTSFVNTVRVIHVTEPHDVKLLMLTS